MSSVKTIAGRTPEQLGMLVMRQSQRPVLPSTRDRTLEIPGRNGAWDFGADMQPRLFSLECAFSTRDSFELQMRVETLARLLVDNYGKPREVELVFSVHPDWTYYVRYSGSMPIDRVAGLGTFSLPLVAFEPYSLGPMNVYETTITRSPEVIDIEVRGNIRTEPVIVLTNQGSTTINGFKITNEWRHDD